MNTVLEAIKNIGLNISDMVQSRFLSPNESEVAYQYILINIVAFSLLLRLGLSYDYVRKTKGPLSFSETLKSVFSKETFFSRSFRTDIGIYITNLLLFGFMAVVISEAITDPGPMLLEKFNGIFSHVSSHSPILVSPFLENIIFTGTLFVVYEALYYFSHRAFHAWPVLWQFHKVHHSATRLSFMTDNRFHIVEWFWLGVYEGLSLAFAKSVCVFLFGGLPEVVAINGVMIHYAVLYTLTLAQHSNLWLSFGRFDHVVVSPAMHIIHHDTDPKNYNTNYALNFATLDYVFGTFKKSTKEPHENLEVGLGSNYEENIFWHDASIATYFFRPFKDAYDVLTKKKK